MLPREAAASAGPSSVAGMKSPSGRRGTAFLGASLVGSAGPSSRDSSRFPFHSLRWKRSSEEGPKGLLPSVPDGSPVTLKVKGSRLQRALPSVRSAFFFCFLPRLCLVLGTGQGQGQGLCSGSVPGWGDAPGPRPGVPGVRGPSASLPVCYSAGPRGQVGAHRLSLQGTLFRKDGPSHWFTMTHSCS